VYGPPIVLVLGASRGTGALCVKSALAKGHSVSAFSRAPAKLDVTHPALTKVAGDFHEAASVRGAVAGPDAVIICGSPSSLGTIKEKLDYFSRGTKYCIDAMKELADSAEASTDCKRKRFKDKRNVSSFAHVSLKRFDSTRRRVRFR